MVAGTEVETMGSWESDLARATSGRDFEGGVVVLVRSGFESNEVSADGLSRFNPGDVEPCSLSAVVLGFNLKGVNRACPLKPGGWRPNSCRKAREFPLDGDHPITILDMLN